MKQCPQCGTITALNSIHCAQCGRVFQSTNPNRTQVIDPPHRARPSTPPWLFVAIPSAVAGFLILVIIGILLVSAKGVPIRSVNPPMPNYEAWNMMQELLAVTKPITYSIVMGEKPRPVTVNENRFGCVGEIEYRPYSEDFVKYIGGDEYHFNGEARVRAFSGVQYVIKFTCTLYKEEYGKWALREIKKHTLN